jgi:SAM-dependent methyltransferase
MDFNQYVRGYSQQVSDAVGFSGRDHDFFLAVKAQHLLELARRHLGRPEELSVLDVGCGVGLMERFLAPCFRRLCGVDLAAEAVREAERNVPGAQFLAYDGAVLPFPDGELDVAFAVCVLHHVPPAAWESFVAEMSRVVRPGGLVAVFEHNPWNPLTRRVVSHCEFDRDAVLLSAGTARRLFRHAGLRSVASRHILFFPWRARLWRSCERALGWLPLGAQYCAIGIKAACDPGTPPL